MINLSIPFWLLETFIGTICLCLLGVALFIGYKIRRLKFRSNDDPQISSMTTMLNNHFQHNLLAMQVDAVFDSLNALIETERIKLKAVVAPSLQHLPNTDERANETAPVLNVALPDPVVSTSQSNIGAQQTHVTTDMESESSLSKAERDLSEKMRQYRSEDQHRLEAVA